MTTKTDKTKTNKATKIKRVSDNTDKLSSSLLKKANNIMPNLGRKIMPDDLIAFALSKLTDEDLKKLKMKSLRQTDIDKLLYQAFLRKKLGSNKEDFSAFTRTRDYFDFVQEHQPQFVM